MALEFTSKAALKNYYLTTYPAIKGVRKETIVTAGGAEERDPDVNIVWYQILFLLEMPSGGFEERKINYFLEVTRDANGQIVSEGKAYALSDPFATPSETLASRINAKLGTVVGGKTLVGIVILNINEQAKTAVVDGYFDDGNTITKLTRLVYDDVGTLKIEAFT